MLPLELLLQLLRKFCQFGFGALESFHFVAQDGFCGFFNSALQTLQPLLHLLLSTYGLGQKTVLEQLRDRFESLLEFGLTRASQGFIQLLRQERLRGFCILNDLARLLQDRLQGLLLLAEVVLQFGTVA